MKDTQFPVVLQSEKYRPAAYLKGVKHYEIPLTEDEEMHLRDLHKSRTIILEALMGIDAQQNEIRDGIRKRTGIDGIIFFRNNNLY